MEQEELARIIEKWIGVGRATGPTSDRELVENTISRIFKFCDMQPRPIEWVRHPRAIADLILERGLSVDSSFVGSFDVAIAAGYEAAQKNGVELSERTIEAGEIFTALTVTGFCTFTKQVVICCPRPQSISVDAQGRLHNTKSAAVAYDGWGVYALHGTRIPKKFILEQETITGADILAIDNAEVRREVLDLVGWDKIRKYMKLLDSCPDPGNDAQLDLYQVPPNISEDNVIICTNGTVERDGTRRQYSLSVPREITSALEAVAWTYGIKADEYAEVEVRL